MKNNLKISSILFGLIAFLVSATAFAQSPRLYLVSYPGQTAAAFYSSVAPTDLPNPLILTNTISTASPATTRVLTGAVVLSRAGSITAGSNSLVGVRGSVTLNSGATLTTGFIYGAQGKIVLSGTLNNGSGFNAGIFGQTDTSAASFVHTSGYLAPIMADFGATSIMASDANANMITVLNTTQCTIHAVQTSIVKASFWQDIQEINGTNFTKTTSTSVTNVGTSGWLKILVNGQTRYIALGDGVT